MGEIILRSGAMGEGGSYEFVGFTISVLISFKVYAVVGLLYTIY